MKYYCKNEYETERLGEEFARTLSPGAVVAMRGGMGVGKTAFVRGAARGLGETGRVTSPTYTIVNEYETETPMFHFDLYRLGSADELFEIGFDDYLARGGICFIEWSENAGDEVSFTHIVEISRDAEDENARCIVISEA